MCFVGPEGFKPKDKKDKPINATIGKNPEREASNSKTPEANLALNKGRERITEAAKKQEDLLKAKTKIANDIEALQAKEGKPDSGTPAEEKKGPDNVPDYGWPPYAENPNGSGRTETPSTGKEGDITPSSVPSPTNINPKNGIQSVDSTISSARMDPTQVLPDSSKVSTETFDLADHQKLFTLMNRVFGIKKGLGPNPLVKKGEDPKPRSTYYELTQHGIWLSQKGYDLFVTKDKNKRGGLLDTVILKQNTIQNPQAMYAKVADFADNGRNDRLELRKQLR